MLVSISLPVRSIIRDSSEELNRPVSPTEPAVLIQPVQQPDWMAHQLGRLPAPPPVPGQPEPPLPPPPEWLTTCLQGLLEYHPNDLFKGIMRYCAVDTETETPVHFRNNVDLPPNVKFMFLPRIRCLDCPGKLYMAGPGMTVGSFEIHLKNRQHRKNVDGRAGYITESAPAAGMSANSM